MTENSCTASNDPVAADASLLPAVLAPPTTLVNTEDVPAHEPFPRNLPRTLNIVRGQNGKAYSIRKGAGNHYVLAVGSKQLNNVINQVAQEEGLLLRRADIGEINHLLQSYAEMSGTVKDVWYRIAHILGGIEIDLGDEAHSRIRITAGKVEVITGGSDTLFYRTPVCQPMVMPAPVGDLKLLRNYLNLHAIPLVLFTAWITYTMAHGKIPTNKFVILVLQGNQGTGKTFLCQHVIQNLIDPSVVGVRILPSNEKDFAIAAQNSHVLCFDNVREFKPAMADLLCVAATGGALTARQLYTDAEQQVHYLHVALVLNGIHAFVEQPDFAQRCLPLELLPIPESNRKSEAQLIRELKADLPAIQRGLFDLIADILVHLPTVEATNPQRMIDFVHWLAAMEQVAGAPAGVYQDVYALALQQGQLDSLLDNSLAAAIVEFADAESTGEWSGTPSELLGKLNGRAPKGTLRSREWPQNPIALSKRLRPLQASLLSQGIRVELHRGKHRTVVITKSGAQHD